MDFVIKKAHMEDIDKAKMSRWSRFKANRIRGQIGVLQIRPHRGTSYHSLPPASLLEPDISSEQAGQEGVKEKTGLPFSMGLSHCCPCEELWESRAISSVARECLAQCSKQFAPCGFKS